MNIQPSEIWAFADLGALFTDVFSDHDIRAQVLTTAEMIQGAPCDPGDRAKTLASLEAFLKENGTAGYGHIVKDILELRSPRWAGLDDPAVFGWRHDLMMQLRDIAQAFAEVADAGIILTGDVYEPTDAHWQTRPNAFVALRLAGMELSVLCETFGWIDAERWDRAVTALDDALGAFLLAREELGRDQYIRVNHEHSKRVMREADLQQERIRRVAAQKPQANLVRGNEKRSEPTKRRIEQLAEITGGPMTIGDVRKRCVSDPAFAKKIADLYDTHGKLDVVEDFGAAVTVTWIYNKIGRDLAAMRKAFITPTGW